MLKYTTYKIIDKILAWNLTQILNDLWALIRAPFRVVGIHLYYVS